MLTTIVLASAVVIFCVSVYLALNQRYEDGIVGNLALGAMAISSGCPVYEIYKGEDYQFLPTTALMYAAFAAFLLRHAYRFARWAHSGEGEWGKNGQEVGR